MREKKSYDNGDSKRKAKVKWLRYNRHCKLVIKFMFCHPGTSISGESMKQRSVWKCSQRKFTVYFANKENVHLQNSTPLFQTVFNQFVCEL